MARALRDRPWTWIWTLSSFTFRAEVRLVPGFDCHDRELLWLFALWPGLLYILGIMLVMGGRPSRRTNLSYRRLRNPKRLACCGGELLRIQTAGAAGVSGRVSGRMEARGWQGTQGRSATAGEGESTGFAADHRRSQHETLPAQHMPPPSPPCSSPVSRPRDCYWKKCKLS